ncbi:MAG: MgtC/SapB family protein [Lentisphaeria bacterium]
MPPFIKALLVSGCLGAFIGLVRQWNEQRAGREDAEFAGVRTFAFLGLLGCLAAYGMCQWTLWVMPVTVGAVGLFFAAGLVSPAPTTPVRMGYAAFMAALLTLFIGALVYSGEQQAAVLLAVGTAVVIALKTTIHSWTTRLTTEDIRSTLQFAAVTGVILPLVPDHDYGPYLALNPHSIWMMVVLISGLGFAGYVLMRLLGANAGILVTGVVGGLASSTATTLAMSRQSHDTPLLSSGFALAVVMACTVMLARVAVMVLAVSHEFGLVLLGALAIMAAPGLLFGLWFWLAGRTSGGQRVATPKVSNPLSLSLAIKFALLYGLVNLLVKAASAWGANEGLLVVSALSGMTDMDAIALSVANNVKNGTLSSTQGVQAILVGAISNTLVKGGMAVALGSPRFRRAIALALGLTAAAAALAAVLAR